LKVYRLKKGGPSKKLPESILAGFFGAEKE